LTNFNRIDKHAFATSIDSVDVGDLEEADYTSVGTYDLVGGNGYSTGTDAVASRKKIQRYSFTTDGNATEVAEFTANMHDQSFGCSGLEHGYAAGGSGIEKHTFDTSVLTKGVGNLSTNRVGGGSGTQG